MVNPVFEDINLFYERKSVKRAANLAGAAYCAMFLLSLIVGAALGVGLALFMGPKEYDKILSDPNFMMILQITLSSMMFTLPFLIAAKCVHYKISAICSFSAPERKNFWPLVAIGIGACGMGDVLTTLFASAVSVFGIEPAGSSLEFGGGFFGILLSVIGVALLPPLVEEFAMRGVVMGVFRRFGDGFAIIVSALLFGFMHGNLVQIPFAFVAGLGLAFVAVKSGSVWTAVLVHLINNATAVLHEYLFAPLSETTAQLLYILTMVVYIVIGIVGVVAAERRDPGLFVFEKRETVSTFKQKIGWFFSAPFIIVALIITVLEIIMAQAV